MKSRHEPIYKSIYSTLTMRKNSKRLIAHCFGVKRIIEKFNAAAYDPHIIYGASIIPAIQSR